MKDAEIYALVSDHLLANVVDLQIVGPNSDSDPCKPYLTLDVMTTDRLNRSLSGGIEVAEGLIQVTLVTETNENEHVVLLKAQEIADYFPHRFRPVPNFLITDPPMVENGYRDGPDWRVPIKIKYLAHST